MACLSGPLFTLDAHVNVVRAPVHAFRDEPRNHVMMTSRFSFADVVDSSFLLFVDRYHRQIYQTSKNWLNTTDSDSDQSRRRRQADDVTLETSAPQGVPVPEMDAPISVDFDLADQRLFWIESSAGAIMSSNYDGSEARTVHVFDASESSTSILLTSSSSTLTTCCDLFRLPTSASRRRPARRLRLLH